MHPETLNNSENPSMEASDVFRTPEVPDPPFLASFPEEPDKAVLASCPEIIRNIVEDIVRAANTSPQAVTAVALALIASALGPNARVQSPTTEPVSAMFNVVVCHRAPRTLPWFDLLANPLTSPILKMQSILTMFGLDIARRGVAQWEQKLQQARHTAGSGPDLEAFLQSELDSSRAGLRPGIATSRVSCQEIARLLPQAFDGGVTVIGFCSDPGEELFRLKSNERARIVEMLNRSWIGMPLPVGGGAYPGTVSLLWQTARTVQDIIGPHGFDPKLLAVPVLMFEDKAPPSLKPLPQLPHQLGWNRTVEIILGNRRAASETVFAVSEEGAAALAEFSLKIEEHLDQVPADCRGHLAWLPDLARRLGLLLSILGPEKPTCVDVASIQDAIRVTTWLARQYLCSVMPKPRGFDTAAHTDRTDRASVMLAKIRTKGPISRRELWRSFDNPRADWFNATLECLISSGLVRYNEQKELMAGQ